MLAVGFDPSFVDTLVRVEDGQGNLYQNLPNPGHHHRITTITRVAGGNGVNISAILTLLDVDHVLVVPSNEEFDLLLNRKNIKKIERIDSGVNESVGITWKPGEMQFNYAKHGLNRTHWTSDIHNRWIKSPIKIFTNWGLNPTASEWIACQWLATCGWKYDEISSENELVSQALTQEKNEGSIILEPGKFDQHKEKDKIYKLLNIISTESFSFDEAIISYNEEEMKDYDKIEFKTKILHTDKKIILKENGNINEYKVPKLTMEPNTYVGAGDAFLAGIIKSIIDGNRDITKGIQVAQDFLTRSN